MALLELVGVCKEFEGIAALRDVSLEVEEGRITGLIGPNGSGKTTLLNVVAGTYRPSRGDVRFAGRSLLSRRVDERPFLGIARTFQNCRLFRGLTVLENVLVGFHVHREPQIWSVLRSGRERDRLARLWHDRALEILRLVGLDQQAGALAGAMPLGRQRLLELARALAVGPRLLLLDEPAAGLNTAEKKGLQQVLQRLRADGLTIVLVEHDVPLVMEVCDDLAVLHFGEPVARGAPAQVRADPTVAEIYLGRGTARVARD